MYAQLVFPIASFKTFTYKIPEELIKNVSIGIAVNATFRNLLTTGYIISLSKTCSFKGKIYYIESINSDSFSIPNDLWKTIAWMSQYYMAPLGLCIKSAIPVSFYKEKFNSKKLHISLAPNYLKIIQKLKLSLGAYKLINALKEHTTPRPVQYYKDEVKNIYYWIDQLFEKKIILKEYKTLNDKKITNLSSIKLSLSQKKVFDSILPYLNKNQYKSFLIDGIPGSGKTEIYIKLAQHTINEGKTVIVLIPEIILTTQMKNRFLEYFGDIVSIWHSKMTKKEKYETMKKINDGQCKIIVGARSCVFTPLLNLGLVIVDEEQDTSYKQESPKPYYHARDVALVRSKYANCVTILTSATPSIETYYNTLIKKISVLKLNEKYFPSELPRVEIIDLLNPYKSDAEERIISSQLLDAIKQTVSDKKQCLLLNNRRGYASTVFNKLNNDFINCKNCSIPLSYHNTISKLVCHYCDYRESFSVINNQKSEDIILKGYGTEKVYEVLLKRLPYLRIERIDSDRIRKKSYMHSILNDFELGKIDVLIGTQMISKGLDFENVQLVGVINADYGMFIPDFRSGERLYQIIAQVIGRAGRRSLQGRAIIQTYNPWNQNLQFAVTNKSSDYYSYNLAERKELNYPPFSRICRIIFSGKDYNSTYNISKMITKRINTNNFIRILGPVEAPIVQIKNKWRFHTLVIASKQNSMDIQNYIEKKVKFSNNLLNKGYKNINIKFDMDPINML